MTKTNYSIGTVLYDKVGGTFDGCWYVNELDSPEHSHLQPCRIGDKWLIVDIDYERRSYIMYNSSLDVEGRFYFSTVAEYFEKK